MPQYFSSKRFEQVLHYVISKCYAKPWVGKTVLFKILYFSDFDYYELNEESLTGEKYRKITLGPAPCHFDNTIRELKENKKIRELRIKTNKHTTIRYIHVKELALDALTATDIQHIDTVIEKISNMNATQVVDYVHKDMPVKATKKGDIIDYKLVFYRDEMFSVREYEDDESTIQINS